MIRTTVKVYLRDENGELDSFITPINLPEKEAHAYYLDKWWNMGTEGDYMMKCYKVETITSIDTMFEIARRVRERLSYHFAGTSGDWNIPRDMPFMKEFLNETRILCELVLKQAPDKEPPVLSPELAGKINAHLHNLSRIDQHNELSMIFWDKQCRREIDLQPWIDEWHACECDFAAWYAKLPAKMQKRVLNYYQNHLKS